MPRARSAARDPRRRIPPVDQLLQKPGVDELAARFGRGLVREEIRRLLADVRRRAAAGDEAALAALLASPRERIAERLEAATAPMLVSVVNATGVVLHTNLGRAPLSHEVARRVAEMASTYSNLEFDLAAGGRGDREQHAGPRLGRLLGAEATAIVNNNAAAVLLAVNTFAEGREVLVSRGELVEIGGSFRIPEVLSKGGARLREVGTTNRTRIADFRSSLNPGTGLILRVHPSNFRMLGFTESPSRQELVALARESGLPFVEDLGSGLLGPLSDPLAGEPDAAASLRSGVDVVTFSGDKLLGGPQAGLVAGRAGPVTAMRRNPLYRALRVDKMTLAALDAVLSDYESGREAHQVPVRRMLALGPETIRRRAEALVMAVRTLRPDARVELVEGVSAVGGGAAPAVDLPTVLVAVADRHRGAPELLAALRHARPPVIARITEDRVALDLRTVPAEHDVVVARALTDALGG